MPLSAPSHKAGLSLLELLVSLALMALIAGGLAGAFGIGTKLWERTFALDEHRTEIALRLRLRGWIEQALPPSRLTPFPADFQGSATGLQFTTLAQTAFAPEAAALIISLQVDDDALILSTQAINDTGEPLWTRKDPLLHDVQTLDFAYLHRDGEALEWRSDWQDSARLPALVKITTGTGTTPAWPDFIVRPRLQ